MSETPEDFQHLLPFPNLMGHSYFWDSLQKRPTIEKTNGGFNAVSNILLLQSFVASQRASFQSVKGLRFVLHIKPNQDKIELFVASKLNIFFTLSSTGEPLNLATNSYFPALSKTSLNFQDFPQLSGIYECELVDLKNNSSLNRVSSLKSLKPDNFKFRLVDVLHRYTETSEFDGLGWDVFWTWQMRLEILKKISSLSPIVEFDKGSTFLAVGCEPQQIRDFCRASFENGREVIMKEKTGLYKIISNDNYDLKIKQSITASPAGFRAVLLRSECEVSVLTDKNFLRVLQSKSKSEGLKFDYLDRVEILSVGYKKDKSVIDSFQVKSLQEPETPVYKVTQIPRLIRKDFLEGSLSKQAWVEKPNNISRSSCRLVCLIS